MSDRVTIDIKDGIADVRLNRPDKMNALDGAMFAAIVEVGDRLAADPSVRVVVLSGEGRGFCAGLDVGAFMGGGGGGDDGGSPFDVLGGRQDGRIANVAQQVAYTWTEMPVPVIAAVHGVALGGGIQIALGADIRFVHPDAQLSVREVHWGLVPDMTGTLMLSRLVRPDVAKELTFTARVVSGREAVELGLGTRLSETPLDDALALAGEIADRSPHAIRGVKELFNRLTGAGAAEQFAAERRVIGSLVGTANQVEAVSANFEKRPPAFSDPG